MKNCSDYYIWLKNIVWKPGYNNLIKQLDEIVYQWSLESDANRAAGGENLRYSFAYETSTNEEDVRVGPCTVLEMLIGVSSHISDQTGWEIKDCFWMLMDNLGLTKCDDNHYNQDYVYDVINGWLNRNYLPNGWGSLFPLNDYQGDCRNLSVWDQMNAWIYEKFSLIQKGGLGNV